MRFHGVLLALAASLGTMFARDWTAYPAVLQIDTTAPIFAVGDVHGDCDRLVRLLAGAHLVESGPASHGGVRWSAANAVLVFTGDLIDKGPQGPAVITLLRSLREQAAAAGGRVVALMGNHEADFLRDPESDKAKEVSVQLRTAGMDPKEVAACRGEVGEFLCGMPFAARVNGWFFAHAGNTGGRTLQQLTADLTKAIEREGFGARQLTAEDSLIQARLAGPDTGTTSWFENASTGGEQTLAAYAAAVGAAHIVQGHQHHTVPFPDGRRRRDGEVYQWRGRLFLIDVGMSREIDDSAGAVLRMGPRDAAVLCPDGRSFKLWDAGKPRASRGVRCGP